MAFLTTIPVEQYYANPSAYTLPIAGEPMQINQRVIFDGQKVLRADDRDINNGCAGHLINGVSKDEGALVNYLGGVFVLQEVK